MPTSLRRIAVVLAAGLLMAASPADSPVGVPEPDGLWTGAPQGYTPKTLKGATVLDIDGLDKVVAAEKPVFLDVAMADRKPAGFPDDRPWLPAHRSIPGAVWLPGAGAAPLPPAREALFDARIEALTGGDKARPIVAFCHPDCWGSWNAAKRLVLKGHTRVYWFPEGTEGWQERRDTAIVKQDAAWAGAEPQR